MATARKPQPFDVDENMRTVVRMLMARDQLHPADLAGVIGVSLRTAYAKLNGPQPTPFKAAEVYRMALRFGVPVETFYRPPALIGTQPTTRELAQARLTSTHDARRSSHRETRTRLTSVA